MSLENAPTRKKSKPIRGLHVAANFEVEIDEEDVKKKKKATRHRGNADQ
jgi:hypothetical protein